MEHTISMIAAIGNGPLHNRVLGKDNKLIWHIPDDLQRFRTITKGHPCVMGRKTYESIIALLGKPLPGRTNIVITHDPAYRGPPILEDAEPAIFISTIEEGIQLGKRSKGGEEVFIIGGGQIYDLGISYADKLYLTLIDEDKEGDSFFPEYARVFPKKIFEEDRVWEGIHYHWIDLVR